MDRKNEDNSLRMISGLMKTNVIVDSAILDIWGMFQEHAITDGGDDSIAQFDHQMFTLNMVIRLTKWDIEFWDNDGDEVVLYIRKRNEVLMELGI